MANSTVIIAGVIVVVVLIIAAYFLLRKKPQQKTHQTKHQHKQAKKTAGAQKSLLSSPPQITSGHYYLQSVNTGLYLDSNGNLHKNMSNANDFYINVDTHQIDPEPKLNISSAQIPKSVVNMYINGSDGVLGITSPNTPTSYVSVTSQGLSSSNTDLSGTISNNYLWKLIQS